MSRQDFKPEIFPVELSIAPQRPEHQTAGDDCTPEQTSMASMVPQIPLENTRIVDRQQGSTTPIEQDEPVVIAAVDVRQPIFTEEKRAIDDVTEKEDKLPTKGVVDMSAVGASITLDELWRADKDELFRVLTTKYSGTFTSQDRQAFDSALEANKDEFSGFFRIWDAKQPIHDCRLAKLVSLVHPKTVHDSPKAIAKLKSLGAATHRHELETVSKQDSWDMTKTKVMSILYEEDMMTFSFTNAPLVSQILDEVKKEAMAAYNPTQQQLTPEFVKNIKMQMQSALTPLQKVIATKTVDSQASRVVSQGQAKLHIEQWEDVKNRFAMALNKFNDGLFPMACLEVLKQILENKRVHYEAALVGWNGKQPFPEKFNSIISELAGHPNITAISSYKAPVIRTRRPEQQQAAPRITQVPRSDNVAKPVIRVDHAALYQKLNRARLLNGEPSFDEMMQKIKPEFMVDHDAFAQKLNIFRLLQQYSLGLPQESIRGSRYLIRPDDFFMLVNNDVLVSSDYARVETKHDEQIKPLIRRLTLQHADPKLTAIGLSHWGNTCFFNTAIQIMIRTLPESVLSELEQKRFPCGYTQNVADALVGIISEGKRILRKEQPPARLTYHERKLHRASHELAKQVGFKNCLDDVFTHTRLNEQRKSQNDLVRKQEIDELVNGDAGDTVDGFYEVLGLNTNPVFAVAKRKCDVALYGRKQVVRPSGSPEKSTRSVELFPFGFVEKDNTRGLTMLDWFEEYCNPDFGARTPQSKVWELSSATSNRVEAVRLQTKEKSILEIDRQNFSQLDFSFCVQDAPKLRAMLRETFCRTGFNLTIPVIDHHGCFGSCLLTTELIVLHRNTRDDTIRSRAENKSEHAHDSGGHFILMSRSVSDGHEFVTFQDDYRDMSFKDFREHNDRDGRVKGERIWTKPMDVIAVDNFTPVRVIYKVQKIDWDR
ncbi:hypothetical protein D5018_02655 [Parashewanella curva]|uniref:Uncharacterized protein n=1 Tax=Parashewanella curva TaxID=2338552 RepID=A0A3L8Q0R1_9GAMM|nr:hypothetical protein [Parashewanella curva]RLV61175.1 hypothetical protein D5018_02655 [Parashewanella curva]